MRVWGSKNGDLKDFPGASVVKTVPSAGGTSLIAAQGTKKNMPRGAAKLSTVNISEQGGE